MNCRPMIRSMCIAAAAMAVLPALSVAQPTPPGHDHAMPMEKVVDMSKAAELQGTVERYNLNAAGDYDSMEVKTAAGDTVQVNFPPHAGKMISDKVAVGATAKVMAAPAMKAGEHQVFALAALIGPDGEKTPLPPPPPKKDKDDHPEPGSGNPHPKDPGEPGTAEGTVKSLNHAHDGRVDGAILDNGTFVHVGPKAAEMLKMKVGDKLTAEGHQKAAKSGVTVLHAAKVNGTDLPKPPKPKDKGDDHGDMNH